MRLRFVGDQSPFVMLNEVKHLGRVGEAPSRIESTFTPTAGSFADAQDDRIAVVGWAMPTIRFADMRELGGHSPPYNCFSCVAIPRVERASRSGFVMSSEAQCSRDIWRRTLRVAHSQPDIWDPKRVVSRLGTLSARPPALVEMTAKGQNSVTGHRALDRDA